jgi:restriction system protein
MAIPDYQTLMLPLLKRTTNGDVSVPEIRSRIADEFGLTQEEREQLLKSGTQRVLDNRLHWARIYLAEAGMLANPKRGRFVATELGKALLARNPEAISNMTLSEYPSFVDFVRGRSSSSEDRASSASALEIVETEETPEEKIESAFTALQATLRGDLIQRVLQNSPGFFERVIVELLVAMGYGGSHKDAATQLGGSGDGGIDGVINEDPLGLHRVYVQAKRYSEKNNVGRPEVQAFVGSLVGLGASRGVFVTTSDFSPQARDFVQRLPQRIVLIDGRQLADLMIEHEVGVRTSRQIAFKRIDEDFFLEEE